ncbi:MAG: methylenetetrahydrofolate reductase [NAD(P)H] [Alphaproteobacteria bacterium]|nr:MAG: methylenetetrahydrofolate reductase [NAD(P)H] [Alphaproteobacteria bacterium]
MTLFHEALQEQLYSFYSTPPRAVSFEFFPPKDATAEASLWDSIQALAPLNPAFVSVTYGAGGSTRARTHATITRLLQETDLTPAAHLTCVGASRSEVDEVAHAYAQAGVRHIVALRGDMPQGLPYQPHPQGYDYAVDLVEGLARIGGFEISVAAYPEMHPQAQSMQADIDYLKRKIDAGATRAITQFFFHADTYLRFLDQVRKAGIEVPIVPGILPVTNIVQLKKFAHACGAEVPAWMSGLFDDIDEGDRDLYNQTAAYVTASLCRRLRLEGVEDFHFYTLNRSMLTKTICHLIGVRPKKQQNLS